LKILKILKRWGAIPLFFAFGLLFLPTLARGGDAPFDGPGNRGTTGLMETPTARVMKEGRIRFGAGQVDPYRYYYGAVSPLKGLEISGRVTEELGYDISSQPGWSGYGNNKDKAIELKYQVLPEGKWWPAIAIGIMDPHGTRKYASQYVVASKQIYPFDFTVGFGNGWYGKRPLPAQGEGFKVELFSDNAAWRSDGQFFGGVAFSPSPHFTVMAEYSPVKFEVQASDFIRKRDFPQAVPSRFNFGLRWRPWEWLEADVSWQRGNRFGANLSIAFDLGVPMIPLYDHPYREAPGLRLSPLEEPIARGLKASGFSGIVVRRDGAELVVEAQNDKYYYPARGMNVMLRVVSELAPEDAERLRLVMTQNGIPMTEMTCLRGDAGLFFEERLTAKQFRALTRVETDVWRGVPGRRQARQGWDWGIKPSFQTFLNDPSGFFKYRLGVRGWLELKPWTGGGLVAGVEAFPFNTVSTSNVPLSRPVRSDGVPYMEKKVNMALLLAEQIVKFPKEIYGRVTAGYLELEYGGLDAEAARPFFGGRLLVGLSGSVVKKRDPDEMFKFKDNDWKDLYTTGFVNARLNLPEVEGAIDVKAGQFLAGDRGARVTVSKFFNGFILSAWYSFTGTDPFTDSFNRGYHDKGIAITIPLRMFTGTDSRTSYTYSLSPWTRDVAQDIEHFTPLFDFIGRATPLYLKKDWQ